MCVIILVLCLLISIVNSTVFITKTETIKNISLNKTKTTDCNPYPNLEFVMRIVDTFLKLYIPIFIIAALNIKVILSLRKSKEIALRGRVVVQNNVSKFAVSTILIDLIFLTFKSPEALLRIYIYFKTTRGDFYLYLENLRVIILITDVLTDLAFSYSVLLFIIFFIFNRIFRKELIRFFKFDNLLSFFSTQ